MGTAGASEGIVIVVAVAGATLAAGIAFSSADVDGGGTVGAGTCSPRFTAAHSFASSSQLVPYINVGCRTVCITPRWCDQIVVIRRGVKESTEVENKQTAHNAFFFMLMTISGGFSGSRKGATVVDTTSAMIGEESLPLCLMMDGCRIEFFAPHQVRHSQFWSQIMMSRYGGDRKG